MKKIIFVLILILLTFPLINAEPSYKLAIHPDKGAIINPDEPMKIWDPISGGGEITSAKLLIYSDKDVQISTDAGVSYNYSWVRAIFSDEFFKNAKPYTPIGLNSSLLGGESLYKRPDFLIKSKVSGDHKITFILTYLSEDDNWYTDRLEFNFHVNSWDENLRGPLIVISIIIALSALIISALPENEKKKVWNWLINVYNIIKKNIRKLILRIE